MKNTVEGCVFSFPNVLRKCEYPISIEIGYKYSVEGEEFTMLQKGPFTMEMPKVEGVEIVGKRLDPESSEILSFVLDDGTDISYGELRQKIRDKQTTGLIVMDGKAGGTIESYRDQFEENNIRNLPVVD